MPWTPPPAVALGAPHDVLLYLDERGVPGQPGRFITAGVLAYESAVSKAWKQHRAARGYPTKGRKYSRELLLDAAEFLIGQAVLPVAVHSRLTEDDAERWARAEKRYASIDDPAKTAANISPASWIWMHHVTLAGARAVAGAVDWLGAVGTAQLHIDQRTDKPEVRARFEELLNQRLGGDRMKAALQQVPAAVAAAIRAQTGTTRWAPVNLNAKGPLAEVADVICAMYAKHLDGQNGGAWGALALKFTHGGRPVPPYLAGNVTKDVADRLARTEAMLDSMGA